MGIEKSYARATLSNNLRADAHHHDHEKLAAVALTAVPSGFPTNLLIRVKYANDATSYQLLLDAWETKVGVKAYLRKWPQHINHKAVARLSLDHWINDVCVVCKGRGFIPLSTTPDDEKECPCCAGTGGVKPVQAEPNVVEYVEDMVEALTAMTIHAGNEAIKKLAEKFE